MILVCQVISSLTVKIHIVGRHVILSLLLRRHCHQRRSTSSCKLNRNHSERSSHLMWYVFDLDSSDVTQSSHFLGVSNGHASSVRTSLTVTCLQYTRQVHNRFRRLIEERHEVRRNAYVIVKKQSERLHETSIDHGECEIVLCHPQKSEEKRKSIKEI